MGLFTIGSGLTLGRVRPLFIALFGGYRKSALLLKSTSYWIVEKARCPGIPLQDYMEYLQEHYTDADK
jgi:hypothetical protein